MGVILAAATLPAQSADSTAAAVMTPTRTLVPLVFQMPVGVTSHRATPQPYASQREERSRTGQVIGSTVMGALLGAVGGFLAAVITSPRDDSDSELAYAACPVYGALIGAIAGFFIGLRYNPGGSLSFATTTGR